MYPKRITRDDGSRTHHELPTTSGTIAITEGLKGTAWQLLGSDGMFHSVTGDILRPESLLRKKNLYVVHEVYAGSVNRNPDFSN